MEQHFRIGEVAEMFGCSIRALRLYDKMDLFKPEHVDPDTGYRYYTVDQMPVFNTMLVLKSIGFHLVEIKDLVDHGMESKRLLDQLDRRKNALEDEMEIARFKIENVVRIRNAVLEQAKALPGEPSSEEDGESEDVNAYKLSRLVCLENLKVDIVLSEVLWL